MILSYSPLGQPSQPAGAKFCDRQVPAGLFVQEAILIAARSCSWDRSNRQELQTRPMIRATGDFVYFSRSGGRLSAHQKIMLEADAKVIARLKGCDFGGEYPTASETALFPVVFSSVA